MKRVRSIASGLMFVSAVAISSSSAAGRPLGHEAQAVIETLLAPPTIKPEPGFTANLLIPPGELYDPLFMLQRGPMVLINDDGKATDGHGGRILQVTTDGKVSELIGADKLLPIIGIDIAPKGFGNFAGQLFALAQPMTGMKGALINHVILRVDLASRTTSVFCNLPTAGSVGKGIPGYGFDAHFGPAGSAFANTFYSTTTLNDMIYETRADGSCKPFVETSQFGAPAALTFTRDGKAMLVATAPDALSSASSPAKGAIVRISAEGKIDPKPVATGLVGPAGIAIAPQSFGKFAGEIFVTDACDFQFPVPQTQRLKHDGKVLRVSEDGKLVLVASGFINPGGLFFHGSHLWVTDINGDFIAGMRELPDGFLVQLDVTRPQ